MASSYAAEKKADWIPGTLIDPNWTPGSIEGSGAAISAGWTPGSMGVWAPGTIGAAEGYPPQSGYFTTANGTMYYVPTTMPSSVPSGYTPGMMEGGTFTDQYGNVYVIPTYYGG